jgi:hypothetical protein
MKMLKLFFVINLMCLLGGTVSYSQENSSAVDRAVIKDTVVLTGKELTYRGLPILYMNAQSYYDSHNLTGVIVPVASYNRSAQAICKATHHSGLVDFEVEEVSPSNTLLKTYDFFDFEEQGVPALVEGKWLTSVTRFWSVHNTEGSYWIFKSIQCKK